MNKRKIIFNPIGSTFKEGDITLKVVETLDYRTCTGCWYASKTNNIKNYNNSCYMHNHACTSAVRKDGKQVVFGLVK